MVASPRPPTRYGRRATGAFAEPATAIPVLKERRPYPRDVSEDCDEEAVLELLDDEYARAILTETSAEPMSAQTLSERCDASVTTVYRRLDRLKEHDLIEEQIRPQPDGNHYKVFASQLESFAVTFEDGEMRAALERREAPTEDVADRFTRMWEDL